MQRAVFVFTVVSLVGICIAGVSYLDSLFSTSSEVLSGGASVSPTAQVISPPISDIAFRTISQSRESLRAAGFPRPSCTCGDFNESGPVQNPNSSLTGFYQTFEKDELIYNRIIAEQMNHLESSGLMKVIHKLHLNYVGPRNYSLKKSTNSKKIVVHKHSNGLEELSLQRLHKHCVRNPQDNVFYIHSKGTFHPSANNDRLRQNLMKGVVSCLQGGELSRSDVCGLRATPLPYPRISGNMWAARCSYIARLPDPASFQHAMERISAPQLGKCEPWALGRGRESAQHWILSHPSAVVSDVLPPIAAARGHPLYTWGYGHLPDPAAWGRGPRPPRPSPAPASPPTGFWARTSAALGASSAPWSPTASESTWGSTGPG